MAEKNGNPNLTRPYVVLERTGRGETPAYKYIDTTEARNAEHAKRVVFKTVNKQKAVLVAVPAKMWSEGPVEKNVRETVSVG
jgi:hypothetical protein